jgi:hypothetical protein
VELGVAVFDVLRRTIADDELLPASDLQHVVQVLLHHTLLDPYTLLSIALYVYHALQVLLFHFFTFIG